LGCDRADAAALGGDFIVGLVTNSDSTVPQVGETGVEAGFP
jgi:hypothetical protein